MISSSDKKFAKELGKVLRRTVLITNPLIMAGFVLALGWQGSFLRHWLTSMLIGDIIAVFCFAGVFLVKKAEVGLFRRLKKPIPQHGVAWSFSVSTLLMPLGLHVSFFLTGRILSALGQAWTAPRLEDYRTGLLLGVLVAGIFFLLRSRADAQEASRQGQLRIHELERTQLQAQLSALTAQMNPHLLFNALNTVASLVETDPRLAEETVLRLSELYRGVLSASGRSMHSLEAELQLCRAYLAVESARFGTRLQTSVEVEAGIDMSAIDVPVLLLQPLVENAVKHGLSPLAGGGALRILIRRQAGQLQLVVEDNGVGLGNSPKSGSGTAIPNCRERLQLCYGDRANFELAAQPAGGTRAAICLPFNSASATRVAPIALLSPGA